MGRYTGPQCRLCRAEETKLFLKGERCNSDKCPITKRRGKPGRNLRARPKKLSDYGIQLREKQKVKRMYGMMEKQFRLFFDKAAAQKGITGEILVSMLERRLDNMVFRMGFASSRNQARQLIKHKHFLVNGRKVDIPSYHVRVGDKVEVKDSSRKMAVILEAMETVVRRGIPSWIELEKEQFRGTLKALPNREDLTMPIQEQLIVELYSK